MVMTMLINQLENPNFYASIPKLKRKKNAMFF